MVSSGAVPARVGEVDGVGGGRLESSLSTELSLSSASSVSWDKKAFPKLNGRCRRSHHATPYKASDAPRDIPDANTSGMKRGELLRCCTGYGSLPINGNLNM